MKRLFFFLVLSLSLYGQMDFDKYFIDKTLRFDYYHTGDSINHSYSFDEIREEPIWGGSKSNLIDEFDYGIYKYEVYDSASNTLIYSRGYSTLFSEWQTTAEAKSVVKTFSETVTMPFPKNTIRIDFLSRDKKNVFHKKFEYYVNPKNYFISPEKKFSYPVEEVHKSGEPAIKVDIVIIPEGYTKEEMEKFKKDCNRFAGYLFNASPYKENKEKFNIWAVDVPSQDSGTDIPAKNIWVNTAVNTNFYTFNLERYLMTADNKKLRDIAACAPYDQIYILVNTDKYGGGAIYNHYSVCTSDNKYSDYVIAHEFSHAFLGLADEYYTSDVAYENFYALDVEPWEANITTLVDFKSKWKDMVKPDIPIPTPSEDKYKNAVGAFEGGGYVAKGVYRPKMDCSMKSISVDNFCPVCKKAIQEMIDFYSE